MCSNFEKCCVIVKALFRCVQGPCETGETVDRKHGVCTSLYKIGNVGHQQRKPRFLWASSIATLYHPPVRNPGAKALIPIGSLFCERRKVVGDSTQCLHISLAAASCQCAYALFPPRKHCWPVVQVLASLLSPITGIGRQNSVHICQRHWVGHMSLAMFYFFLVCAFLAGLLLAISRGHSAPVRSLAGCRGWWLHILDQQEVLPEIQIHSGEVFVDGLWLTGERRRGFDLLQAHSQKTHFHCSAYRASGALEQRLSKQARTSEVKRKRLLQLFCLLIVWHCVRAQPFFLKLTRRRTELRKNSALFFALSLAQPFHLRAQGGQLL